MDFSRLESELIDLAVEDLVDVLEDLGTRGSARARVLRQVVGLGKRVLLLRAADRDWHR